MFLSVSRSTTAINCIFRKIVREVASNDEMTEACFDKQKILLLSPIIGP